MKQKKEVNYIKKSNLKRLTVFKVKVKNSYIQIVSSLGCNIDSLVLDCQDIISGETTYKGIKKNRLARSYFLIPFTNRVCQGKYKWKGKTYQLEKNKVNEQNAIHGLLYKKPFHLKKSSVSETMAILTFEHEIKKRDFKGYPFNILVSISFVLEEKKLTIIVNTTNKEKHEVPYGVGWHPYFKFTKHKTIDTIKVDIPSNNILEIDKFKSMIPTGKIIKNKTLPTKGKLKKAVFDNCFTNLKTTECKIENVKIFWDNSMNFLQVYTPKDRGSIAIEPMSSAPDAFNNKLGLTTIKPKETISHFFGIKKD